MREPAFWHQPQSLLARLLMPLGAIYGGVTARRLVGQGVEAGVPVICVGNYHVGGAGKTPTTLALAAMLRQLGETPVVLSRGYGGRLSGPLAVDSARHNAGEVGDEPLMMSVYTPVVVARDRAGGVAFARSLRASVIVMDDGFQNPTLAKDLSLIVIDATRGVGNGCVFPAGPLRAPLAPQVALTDALIVVGEGDGARSVAADVSAKRAPVFRAHLVPEPRSVAAVRGRPVFAFAGIGDPERFFRTLRASGIEIAAQRVFDDHHVYATNEIEDLRRHAQHNGQVLVTTEKDRARLMGRREFAGMIDRIVPFAVTLAFEDDTMVRTFVAARLAQARLNRDRFAF